MKKRDKIQEAYAEYWEVAKEHVTENGWVDSKIIPNVYENGLDERFEQSLPQRVGMSKPTFGIRPKSLRGIEGNNGWISTESSEPIKMSNLHFIISGFEDSQFSGYYDGELFWDRGAAYTSEIVTHFQYVQVKPNPIY